MSLFIRIRFHLQRFSLKKASTRRQMGIVAVFVFLACGSIGLLRAGQEPVSAKPSGPASHGVELTILDKTCKPCEDFYHYASGDWLAKNPVPAAYPSWGRFNELAERNRELLHQILEGAAANPKASPGSNEQKIGDFYASCMDEKQINAAGAQPLDAEFARIDDIRSIGELQAEIARLQGLGVGALFEFGSTQDAKNSSQVIGGADQGGLGLPDRDYYTKLDDKSKHCISDCFAQVEQCRAYRNAIIHHHIYDHGKGIGSYIDESHSAYQILVSIDALKALYGILCSLLDELREIDLLFRMETDAQKPGRLDESTWEFHPFSDNELKENIIPGHTKRILALQKSRKELQKLPRFPDADLIRSMNEQEEVAEG